MAKHIKQTKYKFEYKDRTTEGVMEIDLKRFESQYSKAQWELDNMVMTSMIPFMPMQTGTFIQVTRGMSQSIAGSGKVVAAAPPMGRYLYEGARMVGERSRSAWAEKGERKVVAEGSLQYSKAAHPRAQAHWFDAAKKEYGKKWAEKAKRIAGGGKGE